MIKLLKSVSYSTPKMEPPPNEYLCPISMDVMTDPVIGEDGYTYERKAIEEWLQTHKTSPMTRCAMSVSSLKSNFNLRSSIERWKLTNTAQVVYDRQQPHPQEKCFTVSKRTETRDGLVFLDIETNYVVPQEPVLIAVLDTSGSMSGVAKKTTSAEGDNFSRLDLIKHSMKTLANLLQMRYEKTKSSLCIIEFNSLANVVMPMTQMDATGLQIAQSAIQDLKAKGGTNIWDGLRLALEQANLAIGHSPNTNVQILVLTDGEPTPDYLPPLGIKRTLKSKLDKLSGKVGISTFGFGYDLDCEMLQDICRLGGGSYGFIPDCSMVGTVFINWCARILLTVAHHVSIKTSQGEYSLGDMLLGKKHTIAIPDQEFLIMEVLYDNKQSQTMFVGSSDESIVDEYYLHRLSKCVEKLKDPHEFSNIDSTELKALKQEILAVESKTELLKSMIKDIESQKSGEGQLMKAIERYEWFSSWGQNHLIAYHRALELRQCINFKDKVLQTFANKEFNELQETGVDIFGNLEPPKSTLRDDPFILDSMVNLWSSRTAQTIAPNPTIPLSLFDNSGMRRFIDSAGPCFTGDCLCLMEGSRLKYVRDLRKGDRAWGGHKIQAVTYTPVNAMIKLAVFEAGLKITPWHPIRDPITNEWIFPRSSGKIKYEHVEGLYNLVLETGHEVCLNSLNVCCLGHGFTDNEVIQHDYFGTQAVIEDLKKKDRWNEGYIVLDSKDIVRDENTKLVIGI